MMKLIVILIVLISAVSSQSARPQFRPLRFLCRNEAACTARGPFRKQINSMVCCPRFNICCSDANGGSSTTAASGASSTTTESSSTTAGSSTTTAGGTAGGSGGGSGGASGGASGGLLSRFRRQADNRTFGIGSLNSTNIWTYGTVMGDAASTGLSTAARQVRVIFGSGLTAAGLNRDAAN